MAVLTVYSSSGDGSVLENWNPPPDWATNRALASGLNAYYTDTNINLENAGRTNGSDQYLYRAFLSFDTSSIPDDRTIISATLSLYVTSKIDDEGSSIVLVQATPASTSSLVLADFSQCGTLDSPTEGSARKTIASITTNAYNDFVLNANGLSWISLTGFTKLGLRLSNDVDNVAPAAGKINNIVFSASETTGVIQDPKLVITYSDGTTTSTSSSTSTTTTTTSTTTTSTSTTMTTNSTSTTSTTTSTTSTTSSTSTTTTSTTTTSSSTTTTSSSTTMPFSIAVDNV